MQFGKIKTEICRDWKEVGQAALTCYTLLLCCRYDKDGSLYIFEENENRENFKWVYVVKTLNVTAPMVSNWKNKLFKKGWICEIGGRIYPVKGFEAELKKLGIDFEKYIPQKEKSSNDMNSKSSNDMNFLEETSNDVKSDEATSNDMNIEPSYHLNSPDKSSNDMNFSPENDFPAAQKTSNDMKSSSNDMNFSSRVIRNTEITENFTDTVVVGGLTTTRAREPTTAAESVISPVKPKRQWLELDEDEERMSVVKLTEHLQTQFPKKDVLGIVARCRQFCRENPDVTFVRERIKGWVYGTPEEINDTEFLQQIDERIEKGDMKRNGGNYGGRNGKTKLNQEDVAAGLYDHLKPAIDIADYDIEETEEAASGTNGGV